MVTMRKCSCGNEFQCRDIDCVVKYRIESCKCPDCLGTYAKTRMGEDLAFQKVMDHCFLDTTSQSWWEKIINSLTGGD